MILIGEMRDLETMQAALTIAETGHLALATLHTNSTFESINRIVDTFPPNQQSQVRAQLAFVLEGVITQQLIPHMSGKGRALVAEVMVCTPAIRACIRDDKIHQIYGLMQAGTKFGMQTMNQALFRAYTNRQIIAGRSDGVQLRYDRARTDARRAHEHHARRAQSRSSTQRGMRMSTTTYMWKGRTPTGEMLSGELRLGEQAGAHQSSCASARSSSRRSARSRRRSSMSFGLKNRITTRDLGVFTRQFATMINAGLPMVQCLDILSSQMDKPAFKKIVSDVMYDVEAGSTLAEALRKQPCFSDLFVNMVEAGEAGGILDVILKRLAVYLEKADALMRKVKGAMTYPAVVFTVCIGASIFMLIFIIPTFAKMFTDFGGELPLPTKIVMGLSDFLRANWWLLAAVIVGGDHRLQRYYKTTAGHYRIDKLLLRMPITRRRHPQGGRRAIHADARHARLERCADPERSRDHRPDLGQQGRRGGRSQDADEHQRGQHDRRASPGMRRVSADGGPDDRRRRADGRARRDAREGRRFLRQRGRTAVNALTSIIEPIMIVVMGGIVGGMLIAMYLPMFKLVTVVSGG